MWCRLCFRSNTVTHTSLDRGILFLRTKPHTTKTNLHGQINHVKTCMHSTLYSLLHFSDRFFLSGPTKITTTTSSPTTAFATCHLVATWVETINFMTDYPMKLTYGHHTLALLHWQHIPGHSHNHHILMHPSPSLLPSHLLLTYLTSYHWCFFNCICYWIKHYPTAPCV